MYDLVANHLDGYQTINILHLDLVDLVSHHLLVYVDRLWHEGVEFQRVESDPVEGGVAVDRVHYVQPRLWINTMTILIKDDAESLQHYTVLCMFKNTFGFNYPYF